MGAGGYEMSLTFYSKVLLRIGGCKDTDYGLSGMPFAGTDIGGFGSDTTPELLVCCFPPESMVFR